MGRIKNNTQLRHLRTAGQVAGEVCDLLIKAATPGTTTMAIEELANRLLQERRSTAPFKRFENFGFACCVSINDEIVNGPPSAERLIQEGDVVSIAIGSEIQGLHGKAARTVYVGHNPPVDVQRLLEGTYAIFSMIDKGRQDYKTLNELIALMPTIAMEHKLSMLDQTGGAGIGKNLHEQPPVPNNPEELPLDVPLEPGLAFVLMPMMTLDDTGAIRTAEDGWTQVTAKGGFSAHFAETILMTEAGLELLTAPQGLQP